MAPNYSSILRRNLSSGFLQESVAVVPSPEYGSAARADVSSSCQINGNPMRQDHSVIDNHILVDDGRYWSVTSLTICHSSTNPFKCVLWHIHLLLWHNTLLTDFLIILNEYNMFYFLWLIRNEWHRVPPPCTNVQANAPSLVYVKHQMS